MSSAEIPEPPSQWWRLPNVVITEAIGFVAFVTGFFVLRGPWAEFTRGVIGGALLGLAAPLILMTPLAARDQSEQLKRDYSIWKEALQANESAERIAFPSLARANAAYYLGLLSRTIRTSAPDMEDRLDPLRKFCRFLQDPYSGDELEVLGSPLDSLEAATNLSEMLRLKFQRESAPELFAFFKLGRLVGTLTDHIEHMRPVGWVAEEIGNLAANPFITREKEFATLVSRIRQVLSSFDETAPNRAPVIQGLTRAFAGVPAPVMESFDIRELEPESEWNWISHGGELRPACGVGDYSIVSLGDYEYALSRSDRPYQSQVTRAGMNWACSNHPEADQDTVCLDIRLVFDHTDGGKPVTHARLTLVQWNERGELETYDV